MHTVHHSLSEPGAHVGQEVGEADLLVLAGRLDETGEVLDQQLGELPGVLQVGKLHGDLEELGVPPQPDPLQVRVVPDVGVELVPELVAGEVQALQGWVEQIQRGYAGVEPEGVLFLARVFVAGLQRRVVDQLEISQSVAGEDQVGEAGESGVAPVLAGEPEGVAVAAVLHHLHVETLLQAVAELFDSAAPGREFLDGLGNELDVNLLESVAGDFQLG